MTTSYMVGIAGGSGSGKTWFLKQLLASFNDDQICLICLDNYYKPREQQPVDENGIPNFDTPVSLDFEAFSSDIASLKANHPVQRLEYNFNNPNIESKILHFKPAPIIITEGIFTFYHPLVAKQLDLKIFIDAPEHIRLGRRIKRDQAERGYSIDDVLYRYEKHVSPTYTQFIAPYKDEADLIIPNHDGMKNGVEVVVNHLKAYLL